MTNAVPLSPEPAIGPPAPSRPVIDTGSLCRTPTQPAHAPWWIWQLLQLLHWHLSHFQPLLLACSPQVYRLLKKKEKRGQIGHKLLEAVNGFHQTKVWQNFHQHNLTHSCFACITDCCVLQLMKCFLQHPHQASLVNSVLIGHIHIAYKSRNKTGLSRNNWSF